MSAIRKLNSKTGLANQILQMGSNQMNICFIDSPFRIWQTVVGNGKSSKFKLQKAQMWMLAHFGSISQILTNEKMLIITALLRLFCFAQFAIESYTWNTHYINVWVYPNYRVTRKPTIFKNQLDQALILYWATI